MFDSFMRMLGSVFGQTGLPIPFKIFRRKRTCARRRWPHERYREHYRRLRRAQRRRRALARSYR